MPSGWHRQPNRLQVQRSMAVIASETKDVAHRHTLEPIPIGRPLATKFADMPAVSHAARRTRTGSKASRSISGHIANRAAKIGSGDHPEILEMEVRPSCPILPDVLKTQ